MDSPYAIDPAKWSWEGDAYDLFYPDAFITEIIGKLALPISSFSFVKQTLLHAAAMYELEKQNELNQVAANVERDAQTKFAEKAEAFIDAYIKLRQAGSSFEQMMICYQETQQLKKIDITLPDLKVISLLAEAGRMAGARTTPSHNRRPPRKKFLTWVGKVAPLFEHPEIALANRISISTSHTKQTRFSDAVIMLQALLIPIETKNSLAALEEAVKQFVRKRKQTNT